MRLWRYTNNSDLAIPSRDSTFECGPLWLRIRVHRGWSSWLLHISTPLLEVVCAVGLYCGRGFHVYHSRHDVTVTLSDGWLVSIALGLPQLWWAQWRMHRMIRRATPEARKRMRQALRELSEALEKE